MTVGRGEGRGKKVAEAEKSFGERITCSCESWA